VVSKATTRDEFGNSILLSERMTAEKLAAEKLAAEKLAAEKLAAEKLAAEKLAAEKLELTEAARLLVEELNAPTTARKIKSCK
jgi:fused signal recognition particle receptor